MAVVTSELVWLRHLLFDFGFQVSSPMVLFCDNRAAIHIASNPIFHERTKHIEIDCHFIREKVSNGVLKLLPVRSQDQLADAFTKSLPSARPPFLLSRWQQRIFTVHLEREFYSLVVNQLLCYRVLVSLLQSG